MFLFRRKQHQQDTVDAPPRRRFMQLGGRRYMANAPYMLPKDLKESDRLDFQHYILRQVLRSNIVAPVRRPMSMVDVGCGTGRWAVELAQQFPTANVVAFDIAPPAIPIAPPQNFSFVPGDIFNGLPFPNNAFDYVHQRLMGTALPVAAWPNVVADLARVTRTGGYVELIEISFVRGGGLHVQHANEWLDLACRRRNIDFTMSTRVGKLLQAARLRNVMQRELVIPIGPYGGRIGILMQTNFLSGLESLRNLILAMHITTPEVYDATLSAVQRELTTGRAVMPFYLAYGQK